MEKTCNRFQDQTDGNLIPANGEEVKSKSNNCRPATDDQQSKSNNCRPEIEVQQFWYLWVFVVILLLLNINGWQTFFWIAFVPLLLLLAVGTKLEHIIIQLAHEVAEKHTALRPHELVIKLNNDHFWFGKPKYILFFMHFILFQNALEIAFFFWIWVQFGFDSCIMGELCYIIPRLIIGVFIQVLCSYSTLPLYALLTQSAIFSEPVRERLMDLAQVARNRAAHNGETNGSAEDAC
ncbi:hypothetical protein L2E82_00493 [Cichorium intybus]|uniref:Uncharacterized protein n=1 Tax=Cichorium intybus TaxID=13427 RepID=A0ACB9GZ30_CICIN|nr:hypothetical protein L2E82_00493 [Cichorium intybus]